MGLKAIALRHNFSASFHLNSKPFAEARTSYAAHDVLSIDNAIVVRESIMGKMSFLVAYPNPAMYMCVSASAAYARE